MIGMFTANGLPVTATRHIAELYRGGQSISKVAEEIGCSSSTVYRYLVQQQVPIRSTRGPYRAGRNPVVCGRKFCALCGRWRHVSDFTSYPRGSKRTLHSRCRACDRVYYRELRKDPVRGTLRREYDRIYQEGQRRRDGVPERKIGPNAHRGEPENQGRRLPIGPLQEWLNIVIARECPDLGRGSGRSGLSGHRLGMDIDALAFEMGVAPRALWRIRSGEHQMVGVSIADRLLTRYGKVVTVNGFGPVGRLEDLWPELEEEAA